MQPNLSQLQFCVFHIFFLALDPPWQKRQINFQKMTIAHSRFHNNTYTYTYTATMYICSLKNMLQVSTIKTYSHAKSLLYTHICSQEHTFAEARTYESHERMNHFTRFHSPHLRTFRNHKKYSSENWQHTIQMQKLKTSKRKLPALGCTRILPFYELSTKERMILRVDKLLPY